MTFKESYKAACAAFDKADEALTLASCEASNAVGLLLEAEDRNDGTPIGAARVADMAAWCVAADAAEAAANVEWRKAFAAVRALERESLEAAYAPREATPAS